MYPILSPLTNAGTFLIQVVLHPDLACMWKVLNSVASGAVNSVVSFLQQNVLVPLYTAAKIVTRVVLAAAQNAASDFGWLHGHALVPLLRATNAVVGAANWC